MTIQDQAIGALTAWREARGGGVAGLTSVLNVLMNRAAKRKTSVYAEAVRRLQFSSMTATGDPNLILFPAENDPQWQEALTLAAQGAAYALQDITGGATSYYAQSMPTPPYWAASMTQTCVIAGQVFFKS